MEVLYLKFNSKKEAYKKLASFRATTEDPDGTVMEYWKDPENYTFDEVGTIYKPTGNMLTDEDGNKYPEMHSSEGWHLNVLCRNGCDAIKSLVDESNIVTPETPARKFCGVA